MIRLVKTCDTCPEQYDAFNESGERVGYLRLRHGHFRVECPDVGGLMVHEAQPDGDGTFEYDERSRHLRAAVGAIQGWLGVFPDGKFTIEEEG